jgi:uncharacterized protein with von Willebrand factor type A (vWA) domain
MTPAACGKFREKAHIRAGTEAVMPGKRIQFDEESWAALDLLARDRMMTFQELAEEAFRDLLRKHNRPVDLKEALRKSAGASSQVVPFKKRKESAKKNDKKTGKKSSKKKRAKRRL